MKSCTDEELDRMTFQERQEYIEYWRGRQRFWDRINGYTIAVWFVSSCLLFVCMILSLFFDEEDKGASVSDNDVKPRVGTVEARDEALSSGLDGGQFHDSPETLPLSVDDVADFDNRDGDASGVYYAYPVPPLTNSVHGRRYLLLYRAGRPLGGSGGSPRTPCADGGGNARRGRQDDCESVDSHAADCTISR